MKAGFSLAGAVLVGVGATALVWGLPIVMLERGAAAVVAGTVSLVGGFVVLALAAVLGRLDRLIAATRPLPAATPASVASEPPPVPTSVGALPEPPDGSARPEHVSPEPSSPEPSGPEPDPPEERADLVEQPGEPVPDASPPPEPAHVVGSYVSGGGSYLLYSDGSIEARFAAGIHRFPSLAALKAYAGDPSGGASGG